MEQIDLSGQKPESFADLCRQISLAFRTSAYFLDPQGTVRYGFTCGEPAPTAGFGDFFSGLFGPQAPDTLTPGVTTARAGESYFRLALAKSGIPAGFTAAGPFPEPAAASPCATAIAAARLCYRTVYGAWPEKVLTVGPSGTENSGDRPVLSEKPPAPVRLSDFHHHSYLNEQKLYRKVTEGCVREVMKALTSPPDGGYGLLSKKDPMRNLKNLCICSTTLATRAAIEGGLASETAYTLSDLYIQKVEDAPTPQELNRIQIEMFSDFTLRVSKERTLGLSKRVARIRNYIEAHIYDRLTVSSISEVFCLSSSYLTRIFKKETGCSVQEFIETARIAEAKNLLAFSEKSMLDISVLLNFHDQSHFTRVFGKEAGMTPSRFRALNRIA